MVLDTLGQELSKIGVSCAIVRFDEARETAFIKYVSFPSEIMARIERLTGLQYRNHPIPKRFWPGERILTQQSPIWFSNSYETIRQMLPVVPGSVSKQVFRLLKFEEDIHLCMVPLIVEDRTIGAMPIWGPNLRPGDGMILSVFASQVAGSIRNIADYENEVERRDELERSNAMILALSNVAARLDTTTNLAQVYETLGSELRKIRVNCIVGTLNPEKTTLKLEYISIMEKITSLLEKVSFLSPRELVVPRSLWPTDKAVTEKAPVWDTDLVGSASRMYPVIPEVIAAKVLEGAGIGRDDPVCHLPMISEEEVVGILSVWGPDLRQADIPGLSVFANQLAAALRNAQLYNRAQKEIAERIQGEGRILEALGEKEVLLKEVHHRVKNNLQVISSLLNLQAAQITDTATIDALRESQNRIRSMALIHEKLYQSSDLTQVDFAGYLGSLVNSLAQTYRKKTARIAVKVEAEKIDLNIDTAIPCGLIVNELVSNSLKYAYPDDTPGVIEVRCGRSGDDRYFLNVRDQGVGLPAGLDIDESPSLGLKLVASLVRQIEGELTICGDNGTCFDITWPSKG
jgi:two-component sensor histidine kinase